MATLPSKPLPGWTGSSSSLPTAGWTWDWDSYFNPQGNLPSTPIGNGMQTWPQQTQQQGGLLPDGWTGNQPSTGGSSGSGGFDKEKILGSIGSMASAWAGQQRDAAREGAETARTGAGTLARVGEMTQEGMLHRGDRSQEGLNTALRQLGSPMAYGNELAQFAVRRALTSAGGLQAGDPAVRGAMGNTSEIMQAAAPAYSVEREIASQIPFWSAYTGATNGMASLPSMSGLYGQAGAGADAQLGADRTAASSRWAQEGADVSANAAQTRQDVLNQLALAQSLGKKKGGWLSNLLGLVGGGLATYFGARR